MTQNMGVSCLVMISGIGSLLSNNQKLDEFWSIY
jgi:hypothetical protein